jgi:hypothetical protein
MEKPITASFRWDKEEMLRASRHAMNRTSGMRGIHIVMRALAAFMLIGGVYTFSTGHTDLSGFIGLVVLSVCFVAIPFLPRLGVHLKYRQMPDRDKIVTWEISADRLTLKTDLATTDTTWGALVRVIRLPDGFLLSPNPGLFQWLPSHAFHDPADIE